MCVVTNMFDSTSIRRPFDKGHIDVAHQCLVKVTRPLYTPPCWRVRQQQWWAWERVGRGKLLLRCRLLGRERRFGARGGGEGRDISWRPPAYSRSRYELHRRVLWLFVYKNFGRQC